MKSRGRPVLLDVNVLIALFDSAHTHHDAAHDWFGLNRARGWRTCPISENGLIRILSHPAYPNSPMSSGEIATRLEEFKLSGEDHAFWPDDFSLANRLHVSKIAIGSSKLTDAYLLMLSASRSSALATFDLRITPALAGKISTGIIEYIPT